MDVGKFNGCSLYTRLRLGYRLRLWAPASASCIISVVAELLVFVMVRCTPLLHQLHWSKAARRINGERALLVWKCRHRAPLSYLEDDLCHPAFFRPDIVCILPRHHCWSSAGCRCEPSAFELCRNEMKIWNDLSQHITIDRHCLSFSAPQDTPFQTLLFVTSSFSLHLRSDSVIIKHVDCSRYWLLGSFESWTILSQSRWTTFMLWSVVHCLTL